MRDFSFLNGTRLIVGNDAHMSIGNHLVGKATKVLIVYGGGSIKRSGAFDAIASSLESNSIPYVELGGVRPNPGIDLVRIGSELCKKERIDFILACGGGSVIDTAKAIAMGACYDGDPWDFFVTFQEPEKALPIGVVLTVPATGSESGCGAVISNYETQEKVLYGAEAILPSMCVISPTLFTTIPDKQIFIGVCDMMSHVLERYFTHEPDVDLTTGLCEAVLRSIIYNAKRLQKDHTDLGAWANLALGANIGHNGTLGIGRVADWACHNIEHEISAFYPSVAHGAGIAVITPAWMRYVYRNNVEQFCMFARNIMGVDDNLESEALALAGIEKFESLLDSFGVPRKLADLDITDDALFEQMAKKATYYEQMPDFRLGNLQKLGWEDVVAILKLAE